MKVIARRNFFAGFNNEGGRINYKKGKEYEVSEKVVQEFPNDFELAKAKKETAEGTGGKK